MSTEIPSAKEKKARMKDTKDREGKSEKKRKREEATLPAHEPTPKKSKKQKPSENHETEVTSQVKSRSSKSKERSEEKKHKPGLKKAKSPTDPQSPFAQVTESFYVALSPCANHFPLEGACAEHISPLLLTFHPPLKGVVLSYTNPRLSEYPEGIASGPRREEPVLAKSVDEYGVTFLWLTAEFVVFRPTRGTALDGYVNLQNESTLGLVCYNYFNAAIDRESLPAEWKWETEGAGGDDGEEGLDGGYYVDGDGNKVEGKLSFRVKDFKTDLFAGTISIVGSLLSAAEDDVVVAGASSKSKSGKERRKKG